MSFLGEIKRRKVFQVAAVYAVVAWLTIQIVDVVDEPLNLPAWFDTVIIVLFAAGFPIAVILGWAFDLTPDGIKAAPVTQARDTSARPSGHRLNYLTQALVLLAVGFLVLDQYLLEPRSERLTSNASVPGASSSSLPGKPAHLLVALPAGTHLAIDTEHPTLVLSPDGSSLVFVAEKNGVRRLYMRELANDEVRPMTGTDGAAGPFFSADGRWIGFYAGSSIKKVAPDGGIPVTVRRSTDYSVNRGATWAANDMVFFVSSADQGLEGFPVPGQADNSPNVFAARNILTAVPSSWPDALPGGRAVLFSDNTEGRLEDAVVAAYSLDTGKIKPLINGGTSARYSSTGHLLYGRGGSLFAAPFDAATIETTGTEFKLLDAVVTGANGAAQFAVAADGTLAYVAGPSSFGEHELVWVDRDGSFETLLDNDRRFLQPRLSPDGRSVAVMSPTGPNLDVWVLNLERGNFTRWTSHPGEDFGPVWGPDGRLAFSTEITQDLPGDEEGPGLGWMAGAGQPTEHLLRSPHHGDWEFVTSWSPDGRWLLYTQIRGGTAADIYMFDTQSRQPEVFLGTSFEETAASFSPNGRWVAYVSDQSGRREVYLRSFPDEGNAQQMSINGGEEPVWSRDGSELFYIEGNRLMAVNLGTDLSSTASAPTLVFEGQFERTGFGGRNSNYDVSPDGSRFLMIRRKNPVTPTVIHVVLNWPEALGMPTQ